MNTLISSSISEIVSLLFNKDDFSIKNHMEVDMPLNKETESEYEYLIPYDRMQTNDFYKLIKNVIKKCSQWNIEKTYDYDNT